MFCKMLIIALIALISKYLHLRQQRSAFELSSGCLRNLHLWIWIRIRIRIWLCLPPHLHCIRSALPLWDWCTASSGPTMMLMTTSWNVCFNKCGANCAFYAANEAPNWPTFDVCPGQTLMTLWILSTGCTECSAWCTRLCRHFKELCLLCCDVISFCISPPQRPHYIAPSRIRRHADVWDPKWCLSRTLGRW